MFLAAAIQLNCTSDVDRNWEQCETLVRRAAAAGATLLATPECTNYLGPHDRKVRIAEPVEGPTIQRYGELASELGVWFIVGSFNERSQDPSRCYNTTVVLRPDGSVAQTYRKVHLFDVDHSDAVRFLEGVLRKAESLAVRADLEEAWVASLERIDSLFFTRTERRLCAFGDAEETFPVGSLRLDLIRLILPVDAGMLEAVRLDIREGGPANPSKDKLKDPHKKEECKPCKTDFLQTTQRLTLV